MSSKRHSVRPVVVDVRPDAAPSGVASSGPSSAAKTVRFVPSSNNGSSRPWTSIEAWSLYHFEFHARQCKDCFDPYHGYKRGRSLCDVGHGLASDVACHVYYRDGDVYSCRTDDSGLVRVEIPHDYDQIRRLLKAMDRRRVRSHRARPPPPPPPLVHSHDAPYPRHSYRDGTCDEAAVIQPATSTVPSDRKSRHKPIRYSTVVVPHHHDDAGATELVSALPHPPSTSTPRLERRRVTSYDTDLHRRPQGYRVEIRQSWTSDPPRPRHHGRRDSVWL